MNLHTAQPWRNKDLLLSSKFSCYVRGVWNTTTVRQLHGSVINLLITQKLHDVFHLYHDHRGNGLILKARSPGKQIKCNLDWLFEDEEDSGIPHCVANNISWLYPIDPKKISCAMLLRDNKSLASAILYLEEQMLRHFCQNYAPINPQSEVETRIDEFLTDARNVSNRCSAETLVFCSLARCSTGLWQPLISL